MARLKTNVITRDGEGNRVTIPRGECPKDLERFVTNPAAWEGAAPDVADDDEGPIVTGGPGDLDKLNKDDLVRVATEAGVDDADQLTKAQIIELLTGE